MVHRVGEALGLQAQPAGPAVWGPALAGAVRQKAGGVELHPLQGGADLQGDAGGGAMDLRRRGLPAV